MDELIKNQNDNCLYNKSDKIILYINEYCDHLSKEKEKLITNYNISKSKIDDITNRLNFVMEKNEQYKFFSPNTKDVKYLEKPISELLKEKEEEEKILNNTDRDIKDFEFKIDNLNKEKDYILYLEDKIKNINENKNIIIDGIEQTEKEGIKILETQEVERKRIAMDLHDTTVQNLTNLAHKSELCMKLIDIDTIRAKLELQIMISTIRNTINDMRSIIYDLRPMSIDDLGLIVTVERYITQLTSINKEIIITLDVKNKEIETKPIINLTLFRIIQEACNNVIKHANVKEIKINIIYNDEDSNIELIIKDYGVGFNIDEIKKDKMSTRFGLSMMRERVYLLSGEIDIISDKDEGTNIYVKVPI